MQLFFLLLSKRCQAWTRTWWWRRWPPSQLSPESDFENSGWRQEDFGGRFSSSNPNWSNKCRTLQ